MKKILTILAALAVALMFMGCAAEVGGNSDMIKVGGAGDKATINHENDTDGIARGFKTLKSKHLDAVCKIETTIVNIPSAELGETTGKRVTNGVMGVIFNYKENDAKTHANFSIVGTRYNQKDDKVEVYCESWTNIELSALEEEFRDGAQATSSTDISSSYTGWGKALTASDFISGDKMTVWIDIIANDGATGGRNGTAGTYTINVYNADPGRKSATGANALQWTNGLTPKASWTIPVASVNNAYANSDLSTMKCKFGFYANVQPNVTFTGSWNFNKIAMEGEEIEE